MVGNESIAEKKKFKKGENGRAYHWMKIIVTIIPNLLYPGQEGKGNPLIMFSSTLY